MGAVRDGEEPRTVGVTRDALRRIKARFQKTGAQLEAGLRSRYFLNCACQRLSRGVFFGIRSRVAFLQDFPSERYPLALARVQNLD